MYDCSLVTINAMLETSYVEGVTLDVSVGR